MSAEVAVERANVVPMTSTPDPPTGLSVTVLGASGTYPAAGGACSGYLLRSATTSIWLDCGSGSLSNLQRHVGLGDIDGIVCSHQHPDHWLDIPGAVNALRYGLSLADRGLPVFWTAGTAALFDAVSGRPPQPTLTPHVVADGDTARVGDVDLRFSRTEHPVETLAVRADAGGAAVAYSADTGDGWDLGALGPGIDLAVIEATLDEDEAGTVAHLTATQAARKAADAGVASLLLTHLAPGSDPVARLASAAQVFDGPVAIAEPGAVHRV